MNLTNAEENAIWGMGRQWEGLSVNGMTLKALIRHGLIETDTKSPKFRYSLTARGMAEFERLKASPSGIAILRGDVEVAKLHHRRAKAIERGEAV
jgi:DNA-binding PadR family transcriptional regulator